MVGWFVRTLTLCHTSCCCLVVDVSQPVSQSASHSVGWLLATTNQPTSACNSFIPFRCGVHACVHAFMRSCIAFIDPVSIVNPGSSPLPSPLTRHAFYRHRPSLQSLLVVCSPHNVTGLSRCSGIPFTSVVRAAAFVRLRVCACVRARAQSCRHTAVMLLLGLDLLRGGGASSTNGGGVVRWWAAAALRVRVQSRTQYLDAQSMLLLRVVGGQIASRFSLSVD